MRTPCLWTKCVGQSQNPPVILISGALSSALDWPITFVDGLADRNLRTISVDLRDNGRNEWYPPGTTYSLEDMADDVMQVMITQNLKQTHVVGASMGGAIAQLIALKYPSKVKSLTMLMSTSTRGIWESSMPKPAPRMLNSIKTEMDFYLDGDVFGGLCHRYSSLAHPEYVDDEEIRRRARRVIRHGFNSQCGHLEAFKSSPSRTGHLSKINVSTLIVHGANDALLPIEHAHLLHENIANSRIHVIKDMGHYISKRAINQMKCSRNVCPVINIPIVHTKI